MDEYLSRYCQREQHREYASQAADRGPPPAEPGPEGGAKQQAHEDSPLTPREGRAGVPTRVQPAAKDHYAEGNERHR